MEANAEKTALAEQRAQKKATRRAAFIQEVAEAVFTKIVDSVPLDAGQMPIVNIPGMWLYGISKERRDRLNAGLAAVSPDVPVQS